MVSNYFLHVYRERRDNIRRSCCQAICRESRSLPACFYYASVRFSVDYGRRHIRSSDRFRPRVWQISYQKTPLSSIQRSDGAADCCYRSRRIFAFFSVGSFWTIQPAVHPDGGDFRPSAFCVTGNYLSNRKRVDENRYTIFGNDAYARDPPQVHLLGQRRRG